MFSSWLCNFQQEPFPSAFGHDDVDEDVIPPSEQLVLGPLPLVGKYVPEPARAPDRSRPPSFFRLAGCDVTQRALSRRRRSSSGRRRRSSTHGRMVKARVEKSLPPLSSPLTSAAPAAVAAVTLSPTPPRGTPPQHRGTPPTPPTPPVGMVLDRAPAAELHSVLARHGSGSSLGGTPVAPAPADSSDNLSTTSATDSDECESDVDSGDDGAAARKPEPMYFVTSRVTAGPYSPDVQKGTVVFGVYYQPPRPRDTGETPEQINLRTHAPVVMPTREVTVQGRNPNRALLFKIGTGAVAFKVVLNTFKAAGMQHTWGDDWNVLWTKRVDPWEWGNLSYYQHVNHFPGTWGIGRKDQLHRNLNRLRRAFGDAFDITPQTWLLPHDTRTLAADMASRPGCTYILKPCASSCGKGIRLITKIPENRVKAAVVQRYIANPFLIDGRKFDIRLYVALTSVDPLRLYIFDEGLCRFTAERYPGASSKLSNQWAHLTNYSINKTALLKKKEVEARGTAEGGTQRDIKWALTELRAWFYEQGERGRREWNHVRAQIEDLVVKTFISIEDEIMNAASRLCRYPNAHGCFEIFGFDVMLDANLRAYLIEVNIMPSLATGTPMDKAVKNRLLAHILTLIGIMPVDRSTLQSEVTGPHAPPPPGEYPFKAQGLMAQVSSRTPGQGLAGQKGRRQEAKAFLDGLSDQDRRVILEAEGELHRSGGFRRVFPTPSTWQNYSQYFDVQRHYNELLARWEYEKEREKERLRRDGRPAPSPDVGWQVPVPLRRSPDLPPGYMSSLQR